jgi:hypothetical protein
MILLAVWSVMIAGEFYVAALCIQNIRRTYPWFTALACFMALKSIALFYIRAIYPALYFYPYYRLEMVFSFLEIGAIVEVFGTLFRPYWTVPKHSLLTLVLSTSGTLALAARLMALLSPEEAHGEIGFYRSLDTVVTFSAAISLAAVLLFARHFQMPYRSRLKGISTGLFIMATTGVLSSLVMSNFGNLGQTSLAFVPVLAHYGTLAVWCYHIRRQEVLSLALRREDLPALRRLADNFELAVSYTPTSCGLTPRKCPAQSVGKEKAKTEGQIYG